MNEQIKKLIEAATVKEHSHGAYGEHEWHRKLDPEKFAELIIQDCVTEIQMTVSLKYKDTNQPADLSEEWLYGHYAGSLESRVAVLKKFGLKL